MKVLVIIPARYASSRFLEKPLAMIGGKTMIERVFRGCSENTNLFDLVVATDDSRIFDAVALFGGQAVMTDENHINGTSRIVQVITDHYLGQEVDWVINIQGDEPLITSDLLEEVISIIKSKPDAEIVTLVRKIEDPADADNPNIVKAVFDNNHKALYFSRSKIPYYRTKSTEIQYQHLGIYAYRLNTLLSLGELKESPLEKAESLEQLRWLEHGLSIYVGITDYISIGVDVPEDIERVEKLLLNK
ncbi:MAG: 3-deoxy-manno-octulosonate cytidylyltransferase [Saprospiraceae bacterium]|nr:3-deoxy-manno-octulosonate cytidylyltransferase [Saprospiraceae bacterium]